MMTVTDIGEHDLKAVIASKREHEYVELCTLVEEFTNLQLHDMCVEQERSRPSPCWGAGVAVLLIMLALEYAHARLLSFTRTHTRT